MRVRSLTGHSSERVFQHHIEGKRLGAVLLQSQAHEMVG